MDALVPPLCRYPVPLDHLSGVSVGEHIRFGPLYRLVPCPHSPPPLWPGNRLCGFSGLPGRDSPPTMKFFFEIFSLKVNFSGKFFR